MDIEIGYYPKSYYNNSPNAGGFFPFGLEGQSRYVFSAFLVECAINLSEFISSWMVNLNYFPIYFCAKFAEYYEEDFKFYCKKARVECSYVLTENNTYTAITEILNEDQLKTMVDFYSRIGSNNEIVLWSNKINAFNRGKRTWSGNAEGEVLDTIIVNIEDATSVFWINYDGTSIDIISNESFFSTYEEIIQTLPNEINPIECEYGDVIGNDET